MTTNYPTENLIAGPIQTQQVKFAADTYYRGMALEYDATNDRYQYYGASTSIIAAIFLEDDDDGTGVAKTANAYGSVIKGGEIAEGGIVDSSGAAMTITEDIIDAWSKLGFYIKRK